MIPYVIDLSHYDEVADWAALKASGIIGVIHKATEGTNIVESQYGLRELAARKAGLLFGAYHFGTAGDVEAQVKNFLNIAKFDKPTLLCLDWEEHPKSQMSLDQAIQFVNRVRDITGSNVVLYTGSLAKDLQVDHPALNSCPLWLAQYSTRYTVPPGWKGKPPWLHQYTGDGEGPDPHNAAGVTTKGVDLSTYYGDPARLVDEWTALATGRDMNELPPKPVMPAPPVSAPPVITPTIPTPTPPPEPAPMPSQTEILRGSRTAGTLRALFHTWWVTLFGGTAIYNSDWLLRQASGFASAEKINATRDTINAFKGLVTDNVAILIAAEHLLIGVGLVIAIYFLVQAIRDGRYIHRAGAATAKALGAIIGANTGGIPS